MNATDCVSFFKIHWWADQWSCAKDIQGFLFKATGRERDITSRKSQIQGEEHTALHHQHHVPCSASNY